MGLNVLVLKPGETVLIPSSVGVESVITEDGAILTTDCTNLPPTEQYVCIRYDFAESDAANPGALEDGSIESVEIGGTVYPLNIGFGASIFTIRDTINLNLGAIFVMYSGAKDSSYADRSEYALGIKIPSSLVSTTKLLLRGTGFPNGLYVIHTVISDCACVTSTSGGGSTQTFCT